MMIRSTLGTVYNPIFDGREGSTMASGSELDDLNSTQTGNTKIGECFALRKTVQLYSFFSCLLLCKATTNHAYNGAKPQDVSTPSAFSSSTTTRRPGRIPGHR
jgi:hypothetical protein